MRLRPSRMVLFLVGLMLALTPMAMASPPDPSWVGGFWDNGDFDDVVLLVTGATGAVEHDVAAPTRIAIVVVSTVVPEMAVPVRTSAVAARPSRAPPATL